MSDGTIRIEAAIDTTEITQDTKQLEMMVEKTSKHIENAFNAVSPEKKANQAVDKFIEAKGDSIKHLEKYISDVKKAISKANSELEKVNAEVDSWKASAQNDLQGASPSQIKTYYEAFGEEYQELIAKQSELNQKVKDYEADIRAASEEIVHLQNLEAAASDPTISNALADDSMLEKIRTEQQYNAELERTERKLELIKQKAEEVSAKTGVPTNEILKQNKEYDKLNHKLKVLRDNQGRFKGKVDETSNSYKKVEQSIEKTEKKLLRFGGALLGVRSAYMLLRRIASQYMSDNEDIGNQLQATWGILGEMLGPVIENLINLLSYAIGYLNVFYKALTGIDAIANYNAKALDKQTASTNKLAKAQRQLAGFDEMTKLSDNSSSNSSETYSGVKTFETPELNPEIVKQIEWLADNMDVILTIAGAIGAAYLAWKISKSFLKTLSGTAKDKVLGALLAVAGTAIAIKGHFDAWNDGVNWSSLITMIGGTATAVYGIYKVAGATAGEISAIVGGLALVITGFKDWYDNGATVENLLAVEMGIGAIGTALALLFPGAALVIGVVAGVAMLITAFVSFSEQARYAAADCDVLTEEEKELMQAAEEAADAFNEQTEKTREVMENIESETEIVERYWQELQKLADENGKVAESDRTRAQFLVNELNDALGTEFDIQNGLITQYDLMKQEVDKLIESKKANALLEAYEEDYILVLKEEEEAYKRMELANKDLVAQKEKALSYDEEVAELKSQLNGTLSRQEQWELQNKISRMNAERDAAWDLVNEKQEAYDDAAADYGKYSDTIIRYENASMEVIQGNYDTASDILIKKSDAYGKAADDIELSAQETIWALGKEADEAKTKAELFKKNYEEGVDGYTQEMVDEAEEGYNEALNKWNNAKADWTLRGKNITEGVTAGINDPTAKKNAKSAITSLGDTLIGTFQKLLNIHSPSKLFESFGIFIDEGLSGGIDKGTVGIIKTIDKQVDAMTNAYDKAEFGVSAPSISDIPSIPQGGIVNIPSRGVTSLVTSTINGTNATENNSSWLDSLAEMMVGNVTIPINLDGKIIANYVIDINKKRQFAMNGGY